MFWSQANGKDWTIVAFLQAERVGLGLDVARDRATAASIRRALGKLLDVPVADLRAKAAHGLLESEDFDALVSDDPVDDLLTWLSDPTGTRARWEASQWDTLCRRCKSDYGFDPVKDGEPVGAERLGSRSKSAWQTAWRRFAAVPSRYAGLMDLLRKARPSNPSGDLLASLPSDAWPQDNEAEEAELQQALHEIVALPLAQARAQLCDLEQKHGMRRSWVWAKLGRAPLAQAIQHLNRLAEVTKTPLTGASTTDLIEVYTRQRIAPPYAPRSSTSMLPGYATPLNCSNSAWRRVPSPTATSRAWMTCQPAPACCSSMGCDMSSARNCKRPCRGVSASN